MKLPKNIPIIILLLITIVISFVIIRKIKNKKLVDDTQQLKIEEPESEPEPEPEPELEPEPEIEGFTGLENNSFVCEVSQEDLMKGKFNYKTCGINQLVLDELNKIKNEN